MKERETSERRCPKCGKVYYERPALSRLDNQTLICPTCGMKEALDSMGIDEEEQVKIIELVKKVNS